MANTPTPHINASPGDFAQTVLMPGDPLRSKFIASEFLTGARLVNDVRGVQGYTGKWKGVPVSVMASGMGAPSIGIYSYELFNFFGVENIIRVGSAGALRADIGLRDLVVAIGACTNSNFGAQYKLNGAFAPPADFRLARTAVETAERAGLPVHVGNVLTSDTFYSDDPAANEPWIRMGVLAIEMEAAALYMNAARAGKHALALLAISDNIVTGEALDADARQTTFNGMITTALDTAASL